MFDDGSETIAKLALDLDQIKPGWANLITRRLRLFSQYDCILGQVFAEDGKLTGETGWVYGTRHYSQFDNGFTANTHYEPFWENEIARRVGHAE